MLAIFRGLSQKEQVTTSGNRAHDRPTVQKETAWLAVGCHDGRMRQKRRKAGKRFDKVPASVQKEMGQPSRALGFLWTPNCDENE